MSWHDYERLIQAPTAVERAVLGDHGPRQRKAILAAWVEEIEAKQGYESNLTAWLKAVAQALEQRDACPHGDDPLLCNECRGMYDEPWDPDPDYDDSLPDWADYYPNWQDYMIHEYPEVFGGDNP